MAMIVRNGIGVDQAVDHLRHPRPGDMWVSDGETKITVRVVATKEIIATMHYSACGNPKGDYRIPIDVFRKLVCVPGCDTEDPTKLHNTDLRYRCIARHGRLRNSSMYISQRIHVFNW